MSSTAFTVNVSDVNGLQTRAAQNDGYVYFQSVNEPPKQVPTPPSGYVAVVYCTKDKKLYVYDAGNGGWKGLKPS